ncbi:hypothetical protein E3T23_12900 [Cryobacterium cheniae]|uniref:Uncharacterized protein n=2 Tax=Cryobacterium cheniae TaxID=1259262 RepID=A0A4R8XNM3_9MICO|nr:hypothetical protein E3T23_12900 [Cryobacterium cheniae]
MMPVLRPVAVVLLVIGLTGCTAIAQPGLKSKPPASATVLAGEPGADLGNGRPAVTFDGLMVRRRVVVAIQPRTTADLVSLRGQLEQAAGRLRLSLTDVSPTVLDADVLESLVPELIVALPEGGTVDDAGRLIDLTPSFGGVDVVEFQIGPVLVHDLRFAVRAGEPQALRESIDREGILTDALGVYDTSVENGELRIDYTGPLLSDDLIQSIRVGIARPARAGADEVSVSPRSTEGVGVQMETEPAPGDAPTSTPHGHGAG